MARFMLDTDTCSYIMKRSHPLVLKRLQTVPVDDVCTSVVTKAEWLYGVEVACVDENGHVEIVRATRDSSNEEELDLWWAHTGGGGGNFGIITRYLVRDLPVAPSEVGVAQVAWDWSKLKSSPACQSKLLFIR